MKQLIRKTIEAKQSRAGFTSQIGLVKTKNNHFVRKVFPTRPILGLFIAGVLAIEVVAVAHAGVYTNFHAVAGFWRGWHHPDMRSSLCTQSRDNDRCEANVSGESGNCRLTPSGRSGYMWGSYNFQTGTYSFVQYGDPNGMVDKAENIP
jgi:hypothetical protein